MYFCWLWKRLCDLFQLCSADRRCFHPMLKQAFQVAPCKWNPQQLIIVEFDTESSVTLLSPWGPRWASRASMTSCPRASTSSVSRGTAMACRSGRSRGWSSRFWRPTSPEENLRNSPSWGLLSRSASPLTCLSYFANVLGLWRKLIRRSQFLSLKKKKSFNNYTLVNYRSTGTLFQDYNSSAVTSHVMFNLMETVCWSVLQSCPMFRDGEQTDAGSVIPVLF